MSRIIRVLIADDQGDPTIRELVAAQEDMEVIAETSDGGRLVGEVLRHSPDIVVLELALAGAGLRALEQMAEVRPDIKTVVLAMHQDISLLRTVMAAGALGYVVYRSSSQEMLSAIRKIFQGRGYLDVPAGSLPMDAAIMAQNLRPDLQEDLDKLSKRESEVLRAVAYGFTNREIAERLGISVKSIETYRYRVAEKLEFKSRADLVRFALEAGLLQMGGEGLPRGG